VINNVVSIRIGAGTFREDPGVVNLKFGICLIIGEGGCLHDDVFIIKKNVLYCAVLHQGVFIYHQGLLRIDPVDFINTVFVR